MVLQVGGNAFFSVVNNIILRLAGRYKNGYNTT